MVERRPAGRPRSQQSRDAVLEATRALLEEVGYEAMTIDAIVERAGVGRQTVYRWWRGKSAIVTEAVVAGVVQPTRPQVEASSSVTGADPPLQRWYENTAMALADPKQAALFRALTAAAASDPADSAALYEASTRPARDELVALLRASRSFEGGTPEHVEDVEPIADALIGALLYRVLTRTEITPGMVTTLLRWAERRP